MHSRAQDKFRRRVRRWLADTDTSVSQLAVKISSRRDTVSKAIHQGRYPRVRARIEEAIST